MRSALRSPWSWAAVLVVVGVGMAVPVVGGARDLQAAAPMVESAAASARAGQVEAARSQLVTADVRFERAATRLRSPLARLAGSIPLLGRNIRTARAMAEAGALVTGGVGEVLQALDDLPGGLHALAPRGGVVPVEPLQHLAGPLERASGAASDAASVLDAAPASGLLAQVERRRAEFERRLHELRGSMDTGAALAGALPDFLGADGPRRYFFAAQNPAELRGTGGFIGAYAIMTLDRGRLEFGEFDSIHNLPRVDEGGVAPPDADFARRWDRFDARRAWFNANVTPDFPSAAVVLERMYAQTTGEQLDGTVLADPVALESMLALGSPLELEQVGQITAGNVVELLANEAYGQFEDEEVRKRALGGVAVEVVRGFLTGGADPVEAVRSIGASATAGHLLLHATDPPVQAALEAAGVSGGLAAPVDDYFAIVANNAAANKADFYTDRTVHYRVELGPGGVGAAGLGVRLRNETPTEGLPGHVIGPNADGLAAGDNLMQLSVYCAPHCELVSFDGLPDDTVVEEREHGRPVFDVPVHLASGQVRELSWGWTLPEAWAPADQGGRYRLTFQTQTTIRPTRTLVEVKPPEGMVVVSRSEGVEVREGLAVLETQRSGRVEVDLGFGPASPPGFWQRVMDVLRRPVFARLGHATGTVAP